MRNLICGKLALGALFVAALLPARANIGDTMTELRQHYGSAKDMGGQMLFEVRLKDGQILPARGATDTDTHYSVTVYFDGVHSAMEVFTRNTSDPAKSAMTDDDIKAILAAIGGKVPWGTMVTRNGKQVWVWGSDKDKPPQIMARFDANNSGKNDGASVLVVMEYTEK